ncbi:MAG: chemotaxis protein MotB [Rhodobacteraceae bacterium]|nr:chemotaxis protein MotB [Paracoccaceae bacterium]
MSDNALAPIIIKRKKIVAAEGHHGGAWKVAYADFVTAMMAFFLLMWLLNATTEKQRKGLADYFSPTIPVSKISGGGQGAFYGDSVFAEDSLPHNTKGAADYPPEMRMAKGESGQNPVSGAKAEPGHGNMTGAQELLEELKARGGESMARLLDERHVVTRLSDAGLVIDIFERNDARLFEPGSTQPTPLLLQTLATVADVLKVVVNEVSVTAHVPAQPLVLAENNAWEVTTGRAQMAREALELAGLDPRRLRRVTGSADREPAVDNPMSLRNSRIEVTVLRDDY